MNNKKSIKVMKIITEKINIEISDIDIQKRILSLISKGFSNSSPKRHNRKWTSKEKEELIKLKSSGYSNSYIGDMLGRTTQAIYAELSSLKEIDIDKVPDTYPTKGVG